MDRYGGDVTTDTDDDTVDQTLMDQLKDPSQLRTWIKQSTNSHPPFEVLTLLSRYGQQYAAQNTSSMEALAPLVRAREWEQMARAVHQLGLDHTYGPQRKVTKTGKECIQAVQWLVELGAKCLGCPHQARIYQTTLLQTLLQLIACVLADREFLVRLPSA